MAQTSQVWDAVLRDDDTTLLFLPLAHAFTRTVSLLMLSRGIKVGYATDIRSVADELPMFAPTIVAGVPRLFERIYNQAQRKAAAAGRARIFALAAEAAVDYARGSLEEGRVRWRTRLGHGAFDRVVYAKLRAAFGGRVRVAASGAAPLGERLGYLFNGVGVTLLEGYGLTETSPILAVNVPGDIGIGTVGRPLPATEVRVASDGELLFRGPQVFRGYWNDDAATREVVDADGCSTPETSAASTTPVGSASPVGRRI